MTKWIARIVSLLVFGLIWSGSFVFPQDVQAQSQLPRCKAGVHLISPSDEDYVEAAQLLHANNGAYCWMTVVFREDELSVDNIQRIHNLAREHKFQILHRIEKGFDAQGNWHMPTEETVQKFIDVLSEVKTYGKDIYVVLGNEPTHAAMCGGCTPENFAQWSMKGIQMLHDAEKNMDIDIHVAMAGHDVASPQAPSLGLYDAGVFMDRMFTAEPDLLCKVDMWVSHSYPRSFVGSALSGGRLSPRGYDWELSFAESKARPECKDHVRELPVFISETGYKSGSTGVTYEQAQTGTQQIVSFYENDPRVHMYTFFVYRACGEPFESFALAGCDLSSLNGSGQALRDALKTYGDIRHIRKARTVVVCPEELVENMDIECQISVTNLGTDIWADIGGDYGLSLIGVPESEDAVSPRFSFTRFRGVHPGENLDATLTYNPGLTKGTHDLTIGLVKKGRLLLGLANWNVETFEAPSLDIIVENIFGRGVQSPLAQVQIFDQKDDIVYRTEKMIVGGFSEIGSIPGVNFGLCYRVVLLVDGSLPVQKECVQFEKGNNTVEMPRLLGIDRNNDGKLSFADVVKN